MKIILQEISAKAIIGCLPYERELEQEIVISLSCELYKTKLADYLTSTIDYVELCNFVKKIVSSTKFQLLESLLNYLVEQIFMHYPLIKTINLELGKPQVYASHAKAILIGGEFKRKHKVAIALGSNLNNPKSQIITASELLGEFVQNILLSPIYQSKPYGYLKQDNFYNGVLIGDTELEWDLLFIQLKKIEKLMGKQELFKNGPRIIDLDLIFYADKVIESGELKIPHPHMHERDFVLKPLSNIASEWEHPVLKKSVQELLASLALTGLHIQE